MGLPEDLEKQLLAKESKTPEELQIAMESLILTNYGSSSNYQAQPLDNDLKTIQCPNGTAMPRKFFFLPYHQMNRC